MIDCTLAELARALADGHIRSTDITLRCLERIAQLNANLGAFLYIDHEGALIQATASDARRKAGTPLGPLDGIPIAVKDLLLTEGLPTTAGSKILASFIAPYDGTVVRHLKNAGAVLLGKLNMDEFAMGSTNENSAFMPAKNPWNTDHSPGGSSGGSAVAVASGMAFASIGTDTGGSIRQPAAWTGTVGLKPTYGRVSRYGVIAFASSLDQVGPMAKTVTDCAMMLQVIAGHDAKDATSSAEAVPDYCAQLEAGVHGMRLGVPREYLSAQAGLAPEVHAAIDAALRTYEQLGATLVDISLPHTAHGIATYYVLANAEASSNLARYDGVRYGMRQDPDHGLAAMYTATRGAGFGPEVKRRIMLGTYALSAGYYDAYYLKAQHVRTLVRDDFAKAFAHVDAIIAPTAPTTASRLGVYQHDPVAMYLADVFTVGANLAGIPGISLPCGMDSQRLPIGVQLLGPAWSEAKLLQIARAYERATSWHTERAVPS